LQTNPYHILGSFSPSIGTMNPAAGSPPGGMYPSSPRLLPYRYNMGADLQPPEAHQHGGKHGQGERHAASSTASLGSGAASGSTPSGPRGWCTPHPALSTVRGFAKGLFVDTVDCSHVVYCDPDGNPKGILSEVKGGKGIGKGKVRDKGLGKGPGFKGPLWKSPPPMHASPPSVHAGLPVPHPGMQLSPTGSIRGVFLRAAVQDGDHAFAPSKFWSQAVDGGAASDASGPMVNDHACPSLFVGRLKNFDFDRDAGFVECQETRALYKCDVYIHGSALPPANRVLTAKPFGFKVHTNQYGFPQVTLHSVIELANVFLVPRLVGTFVGHDTESPDGQAQVTNLALHAVMQAPALGDRSEFQHIGIGSVVSFSVKWMHGWPVPQIQCNSVEVVTHP